MLLYIHNSILYLLALLSLASCIPSTPAIDTGTGSLVENAVTLEGRIYNLSSAGKIDVEWTVQTELRPFESIQITFGSCSGVTWTYTAAFIVPYHPTSKVPLNIGVDERTWQTTERLSWTSSLAPSFFYPFDEYTLNIPIHAVDARSNISIPIKAVILHDLIGMFNVLVDPHVLRIQAGTMPDAIEVWHVARGTLRRTLLVKTIAITTLLASWISTAFSLSTTLRMLFRCHVSDNTLLFPFTAIALIGSLRAWWVGAPQFNILMDYIGTLPQLMLVTISMFGDLGQNPVPA